MAKSTQVFHLGNECSFYYELSNYVEPDSAEIQKHPQEYDKRALIPKVSMDDRRVETSAFDQSTYRNGRDVLVGKFAYLEETDLTEIHSVLKTMSSLDILTANKSYDRVLRKFNELVSAFTTQATKAEVLGVLLSPPGFYTTTYDFNKKCYLGLHIDNWDSQSQGTRHKGRQRIILNIAPESRVFLFSARAVDELELDWSSGKVPTDLLHDAGKEAVGRMHYVIIPSLGFCISPTENIIHDGSTLQSSTPSIALTALFHTRPQLISRYHERVG